MPELLYLSPGTTPMSGSMDSSAPSDLNATYGVVLPGTADVASLQFSHESNRSQLLGPMLLGLWIGPSPTLMGNITAVLQEGGEEIGSASVNIALDPMGIDPTTLLPPDPSDPAAAAAYVAAKAAAALMAPPVLLDLGYIEHNLTDGDISLSFFLEGEPLALGAATVQYDSALSPSFLYLPFYEPDPPAEESSDSSSSESQSGQTSSPTSEPSSPGSSSNSMSEKDDSGMLSSEPESEDTPPVAILFIAVGLVAIAAYRRS